MKVIKLNLMLVITSVKIQFGEIHESQSVHTAICFIKIYLIFFFHLVHLRFRNGFSQKSESVIRTRNAIYHRLLDLILPCGLRATLILANPGHGCKAFLVLHRCVEVHVIAEQ